MESSCSTNNGLKVYTVQNNRTLSVFVNKVAGMDIDVNSRRTQRRQENRELIRRGSFKRTLLS